ncbi:hypothetical protein C1H46_043962 [Malus baccata]|uniref:Uncharacterized protein n=1 Tax=Malus baccata TaxID=106549 RepID=A0A540K8F8_MALBA|nr:hypothetical protein C1H46_043962 [Malus baccata]
MYVSISSGWNFTYFSVCLPASNTCENCPKNDRYAGITTADIDTLNSDCICSSLTTHVFYVLWISSNKTLKLWNLSFNTGFATFPFTLSPSWLRRCSSRPPRLPRVVLVVLPQIRRPPTVPRVAYTRVDLCRPFDFLQDVSPVVHHEDGAQSHVLVQLRFRLEIRVQQVHHAQQLQVKRRLVVARVPGSLPCLVLAAFGPTRRIGAFDLRVLSEKPIRACPCTRTRTSGNSSCIGSADGPPLQEPGF